VHAGVEGNGGADAQLHARRQIESLVPTHRTLAMLSSQRRPKRTCANQISLNLS